MSDIHNVIDDLYGSWYIDEFEWVIGGLRTAAKFIVNDPLEDVELAVTGHSLVDDATSLESLLPYPIFTIEFSTPVGTMTVSDSLRERADIDRLQKAFAKQCMLVHAKQDGVMELIMISKLPGTEYLLQPVMAILKYEDGEATVGYSLMRSDAERDLDKLGLTPMDFVKTAFFAFHCFLGLLDSTCTQVKTQQASEALNKARAKRGRSPLYEHHVVTIEARSASGRLMHAGGTHASPRKHWRRGHRRVLHRGKPNERSVWISAMLVSGRGFISKDYVL